VENVTRWERSDEALRVNGHGANAERHIGSLEVLRCLLDLKIIKGAYVVTDRGSPPGNSFSSLFYWPLAVASIRTQCRSRMFLLKKPVENFS